MERFNQLYKVPVNIIPFLFEIMLVKHRVKPGCRITICTTEIESIDYFLNELQLKYFILFHKRTTDSYLQYSSSRRLELIKKERAYMYIAITHTDAKKLFETDALKRNYYGFGRLLGYPECCTSFAMENDKIIIDSITGEKRQVNLCSAAIKNTIKIDFRCNNFISASNLSDNYPLNIFSHYPCNYCCKQTIDYSDATLRLVRDLFPRYYETLINFLNYNIIYWPDSELNIEHISEFNAIAIKYSRFNEKNKTIENIQGSINIGCGYFFGDQDLMNLQQLTFFENDVVIQEYNIFSNKESSTKPFLLEWTSGFIKELA